MSTSTKRTKTRAAEQPDQPATLRDKVRATVNANEDYTEAVTELHRLQTERMQLEAKHEQLQAALQDTDSLVAKIEAGAQLTADDTADEIRVLRQQITAYRTAENRAEQRRRKILRDISAEVSAEFAGLHRQRVQSLVDALAGVVNSVQELNEVPAALAAAELSVDLYRFPMFHRDELVQLGHRLQHLSEKHHKWLQGIEV